MCFFLHGVASGSFLAARAHSCMLKCSRLGAPSRCVLSDEGWGDWGRRGGGGCVGLLLCEAATRTNAAGDGVRRCARAPAHGTGGFSQCAGSQLFDCRGVRARRCADASEYQRDYEMTWN